MIELYIGGQAVDTAPDTKITLNFNSNIFGDLSKIEASNSYTIALPKTVRNRAIFGTPTLGSSTAPYRRWDAELYVNGVEVVDTAYVVLLSEGENYEVSLYWGVVTALSQLKEGGSSIADINEVLSIQYGGDEWWRNWDGKRGTTSDGSTSSSIINAVYESGIEDLRNDAVARAQVALLPSVRASWVWNSIIADNGLNISTPALFDKWLTQLALPFATHKISLSETDNYAASLFSYTRRGQEALLLLYGGENIDKGIYAIEPIYTAIELESREFQGSTVGLRTTASGKLLATVHLSLYAGMVIDAAAICFAHYNSDGELQKEFNTQSPPGASSTKEGRLNVEVDMSEGDYVVCYVRLYNQTGFDKSATERASITLHDLSFSFETESAADQQMGGTITTRDNLPDIKQLDFVKAMTEMYGLWATLIDGVVHFVPYSDLYTNTPLDWSHKLVGTGDASARNNTFTLGDYAQRNILRYKDDETTEVDANGVLLVENKVLDDEKDMLTLPFAASDGNIIPHLKWKDDDSSTSEVEEVKVEQRIMVLTENISTTSITASLSFKGLSFSQLVRERYRFFQEIIRKPIVIEEQVLLSEIDIKNLDYRRPIFLQKYGACFAIKQVQWSESGPSAVTLIKLPPAKEIGVALPYFVTTGVTFGVGINGVVKPTPAWAHLVSGAGDYFAQSAVLSFDEATANAQYGIGFSAWTTEAGVVLSTNNPYTYDGRNGDMTIYANTIDILS